MLSICPTIQSYEGYRSGPAGYEAGLGYERVMTKIPGAVIMPKTTEEVQKIVKICSRYCVPYVLTAPGFMGQITATWKMNSSSI